MAERHTELKDIQKDCCDSTELDSSSCTGSYQESNPTQSTSLGSDWESQDRPLNDVNMVCIDDGSSSRDGEEPMSSTQSVPPREEKQEMDEGGASDHQEEGELSSEKETSDGDEKSEEARLAKKKRGKAKAVKAKDKDSGHICSQGRHEASSDEEESNAESLAKKKKGKSKAVKKQRTIRVKVKREWNEAERAAVQRHFGSFITQRRIPRKEHCLKCLKEEKDLCDRSWKDVKNYVYKTVVAMNRRSTSRRLYF